MLGTLKYGRLFVPPALILFYAKLLGQITGWWDVALPDFSKAQYLPSVVVLAVFYYITPLREYANAPNHKKITDHLRSGLVKISGYSDKPDKYSWKKLKTIFFDLVDQDKSLSVKANLAYVNGLIWTSFADATVLALLYFLFSVCLFFFGLKDAVLAVGLFFFIAVACRLGSLITTNRQISIGQEQLDIISSKYSNEIRTYLKSL